MPGRGREEAKTSQYGATNRFAVTRVTLRRGESSGAEPETKGRPLLSKVQFAGLDVHAETIAVAVGEMGGEVRSLGVIPNRLESVGKMVHKLGAVQPLRACYEAGPTGYVYIGN